MFEDNEKNDNFIMPKFNDEDFNLNTLQVKKKFLNDFLYLYFVLKEILRRNICNSI